MTHLPDVIQELLTLTGDPQWKLAKKLGTTQPTISKWLRGLNEPSLAQWRRIEDLYCELKGWSIDRKIAPYDDETRGKIRDLVDHILKNLPPPRRRP